MKITCLKNALGQVWEMVKQNSEDLIRFQYVSILQEEAMEWLFLKNFTWEIVLETNLFCFATYIRIQILDK